MIQLENYLETSCIMEGYVHYLFYNSRKANNYTIQANINIVRKFHNYIGKPYVDIKLNEIKGYFKFLIHSEQLSCNSVIRDFGIIKKFYEYLELRDEISENPISGFSFREFLNQL